MERLKDFLAELGYTISYAVGYPKLTLEQNYYGYMGVGIYFMIMLGIGLVLLISGGIGYLISKKKSKGVVRK